MNVEDMTKEQLEAEIQALTAQLHLEALRKEVTKLRKEVDKDKQP